MLKTVRVTEIVQIGRQAMRHVRCELPLIGIPCSCDGHLQFAEHCSLYRACFGFGPDNVAAYKETNALYKIPLPAQKPSYIRKQEVTIIR